MEDLLQTESIRRRGILATFLLTENSHQGFEAPKSTPHQGATEVNSNLASAIAPRLRQERIGPRCSGKERDAESGLDYFLARHFSGPQGRFTSPDPQNAGASPDDPQSWNGYAYARNNPLKYTDPDGLKYRLCDNNGNCIDNYSDADFNKYLNNTKGVTAKNGQLLVGKEVIGTYEHLSFDDFTPLQQAFFNQMSGQREATKQLVAGLAAESVVLGVTDFLVGKAVQAGVEAYQAYKTGKSVAAEIQSILTQAAQTTGNKGAIASSKEAAMAAAEQWVGVGARPIYKGGEVIGKVSADGRKVYRITSIDKPQPYVNLVNKATGGNLHVRF